MIASQNPLFARGLQKLLVKNWGEQVKFVGITATMEETLAALEKTAPDLVVLDYDDENLKRDEFLNHFVAGKRPMQVMLVSLQETGGVVVYDRKTMSSSQAEDWLKNPLVDQAGEPLRNEKRNNSMKHFFIVAVLVVVLTVIVQLGLTATNLLPVEASTQAVIVDRLFNVHFFLISFLFSLIVVFIGYSLVVFRRKPGENGDGVHIHGNSRLEIFWTILPLGTVIYLAFLGAQSLGQVRQADPKALKVNVTAGQWYWVFEYPELGVSSSQLYLPVDRQVVFSMTSKDVIHSFWVPEFRLKQDLLPGKNLVKELRITPNLIGKYKVRCAELCGTSHAYMEAPVVVVSAADFDQWAAGEVAKVAKDPVARGKKWASEAGCLSCHSVNGAKGVGPTWKGLAGSQVVLTDGSTVAADDAYLQNSIINPPAQVVKGFAGNVMPPTYAKSLTSEKITDILEFIKSLK